jgi:hypothetical protein
MRGLVINGFTVVEALGSGQGGILYLARDAAGREAVIRVARDGEDNLSIRIFTEEAQKLVPAATSLETSTTPDGRRVLMAMAAPPAQVRPPPPGSGFTQHAVTQQLPRPEPLPTPTSKAPFAVLLLALVVFGAGAAMIALSMRSPPAATIAWVPAPVPPAPPSPSSAVSPDAAVALAAAVQPPPLPAAAPSRPTASSESTRPATDVPGIRECVMSAHWRRAAKSELHEYRQLVAAVATTKTFGEYEEAQDRVLQAANAAPDGSDCRALDAKIEALTRIWEKRFNAVCPANGAWKVNAKQRVLNAEHLAASKGRELIDQIDAAKDRNECLTVHRLLASFGISPTPKPSFVCEPTAEWKELMSNNLAALETYGRELPALEMSIEAEKVGRAIATAKTAKDCAAALQQFEALKKRALK